MTFVRQDVVEQIAEQVAEHRAEVVPHRRWAGWWRWRCTCGDWARANNRDVMERTLAWHLELAK